MTIRAYKLLPDSALATVSASLGDSLRVWSRDWGLGMPSVGCRRAWETESAVPAARLRLGAGEEAIWLCWRNDLCEQLARAMFAPDRATEQRAGAQQMAADAAQAALEALVEALGFVLRSQPVVQDAAAALPAAACAAGSGAVLAELRFHGFALFVLLEHQVVSRIAAPADAGVVTALPALDCRALLAEQPVRLSLEAGRATVGLGSLLRLAPGDVIRLDALLEAPLTLACTGGAVVARGYLGTQDHHFALDLVAGGSTSGEHP